MIPPRRLRIAGASDDFVEFDEFAAVEMGGGDPAFLSYSSGSTGQPKGVMVAHINIMRNCEFIRHSRPRRSSASRSAPA